MPFLSAEDLLKMGQTNPIAFYCRTGKTDIKSLCHLLSQDFVIDTCLVVWVSSASSMLHTRAMIINKALVNTRRPTELSMNKP